MTDPWVRVPYSDLCVECLEHRVQPATSTRLGREMVCRYSCPCGFMWSTRWQIGAVEGWSSAA